MANRIMILFALALFLVGRASAGIPYKAETHYFLTPNGGKIVCNIKSEQDRTVTITNKIYASTGGGFISFSRTYTAEQEAKGNVTIPASVDVVHVDNDGRTRAMGVYRVVSIESEGLSNCKDLTSITLPPTITRIGARAFQGCEKLKTINLPPNLLSLDLSFAEGCNSLEAVNIPSQTNMVYSSFDGVLCKEGQLIFCPYGRSEPLIIPSTVKEVAERACEGRKQLTSVVIKPNGVKKIGSSAFKNCESLFSFDFGNSVTEISDEAFAGCQGLEEVVLPNSLKEIGNSAFKGCMLLTRLTLGTGLVTIGTSSFEECRMIESLAIPGNVKNIYSKAFKSCSGIKSLTFSEGLTYIGTESFSFCSSLTSLTLPNSLNNINESAFMGCTGLQTLTLGSGLTSLPRYAFYGCENLVHATIPKTITSIPKEAFMGCDKFTFGL